MNLDHSRRAANLPDLSVHAFASGVVAPRAAAIEQVRCLSVDVMREAASRGLLGITTPQQWGGLGLDLHVSYALAIETVSRASAAAAVSMVVHLVSDLIAYAGRTSQKEQWLRRLASGEALGHHALSEPDAGTDAANQQTRRTHRHGYPSWARRCGWRMPTPRRSSWSLRRPTRTRGQGVTAFLIPASAPASRRLRGPTRWRPRSRVHGPRTGRRVSDGRCWVRSTRAFAWRWSLQADVGIAAHALGCAVAIDETIRFAKVRHTFGKPSGSYGSHSVDAGRCRD